MNKKHLHPILLVALLLSTAQICMAQQRALVLHHADGTTTDVELLKLPRVVFSGDKVVIGTVDNTLLEFAKEDVLTFTYKNVGSTGISNVGGAEKTFRIYQERIVFHGVADAQSVRVFTVDGKQVATTITVSDGATILSLTTSEPASISSASTVKPLNL